MYCQICGANETRYVRDHNHKTGYIRGILCEVCNSYLGTFVKNLFFKKGIKGSKNYRNWAAMFETKILDYLCKATPYVYPWKTLDEVWAWFTKDEASLASSLLGV